MGIFAINLDNPSGCYFAGQVVTGRVILNLDTEKKSTGKSVSVMFTPMSCLQLLCISRITDELVLTLHLVDILCVSILGMKTFL